MKHLEPGISNRKHGDGAYHLAKRLAIRLDDVALKTSFFSEILNDPDFKFRLEAAILLSKIDKTQTNGIPVLLNAITNQNAVDSIFTNRTHVMSINGLEKLRTLKQEEALDALQQVAPQIAELYLLNDSNP